MKKSALISAAIIACCILHTACCFSQGTAINSSGVKADSSAMLDVSDTTKGILIPRMKKTNKLSISSPATGLMIYQTNDTTGFWYYNGAKWMQALSGASGSGGSGFIPAYPDGFTGITPVLQNNLNTTPYTVPAGKTFYLTSFFTGSSPRSLLIDNITVFYGFSNFNQAPGYHTSLIMPLIAPATKQVKVSNNAAVINGFLVDEGVTVVNLKNLKTTTYTVPAGKTLFINNCYMESLYYLYVNAIPVFYGYVNYSQKVDLNGGLNHPVIVAAGNIVSSSDDSVAINGFLY